MKRQEPADLEDGQPETGKRSSTGSPAAAITAYLSVRLLVRYFQTRTLTPFAIYCLALGALSVARFAF